MKALEKNSCDVHLYYVTLMLSKGTEKDTILVHHLNNILDNNIMISGSGIFSFVQEAIKWERYE